MSNLLLSPEHQRLIEISPDFLAHENGSDLFIGYLLTHMTYFPQQDLLYMTYEKYKKEIPNLQNLLNCKSKRSVENQLNYWLTRSNDYLAQKTLLINNKTQNVLTIRQPPDGTQWIKISKEIIDYIINTKVPNSFRIYVWLAARQQSFHTPLIFHKTDLAFMLNYSCKKVNYDTREKIQNCLDNLTNLGIIEYAAELFVSEKQDYAKSYRLTFIHTKNKIPSPIAAPPLEPEPESPLEEYTSQQKAWLEAGYTDGNKTPHPKVLDPTIFLYADSEKRFWKPAV